MRPHYTGTLSKVALIVTLDSLQGGVDIVLFIIFHLDITPYRSKCVGCTELQFFYAMALLPKLY